MSIQWHIYIYIFTQLEDLEGRGIQGVWCQQNKDLEEGDGVINKTMRWVECISMCGSLTISFNPKSTP